MVIYKCDVIKSQKQFLQRWTYPKCEHAARVGVHDLDISRNYFSIVLGER